LKYVVERHDRKRVLEESGISRVTSIRVSGKSFPVTFLGIQKNKIFDSLR